MGDVIDLALARELRSTRGSTKPLERAAARRELTRIRPGAYVDATEWRMADDAERHRTAVYAARAAARSEPTFSHESAAALHRIPTVGEWPLRPVVTLPRGRGCSTRVVERVHRDLDPEDIVEFDDGIRATSAARTAIDLAARRSPLSAVIAMSHVRNAGVGDAELDAAFDRAGRMAGIRSARIVRSESSALSESPLETLVMVRCRDLGFAEPEQQRVVRGADGVPYRVDFAWRDGRILGEADGRLKYRSVEGAPTPQQVLWAEKRREDALRIRCDRFVRIAWEDAWHGAGLEALLVEAGVPRVGMPRRRLTF